MATTHYAELKVYALETPGVVNASCEFNVETLMPTYKLSVGVPGKSNAFLISAKLGIPQEIIDAARNHMSNDDKRLDSVLSQLDDLKVQLKDAQAEAEQARYEAEHALESAEKKTRRPDKKGEEELENARRQAHDLMQQVQNEAYSLTDELRRIQKDEKTSAAQRAVRAREIARRDTETLLKKTDAKPQPVKEFVPLKEVQIGQEVVIADLGQTATVTARPDRNGMVEVRAGIMKTKVPLTNLRAPDKMEKRKPAEPRRSTRVQLDKSRKTSMELNLLGYTVDEALNEVDKVPGQRYAARAVHALYHPRQRHRRAAHGHPEASAHPQGRQELPPGPLRRGRERRDRCGIKVKIKTIRVFCLWQSFTAFAMLTVLR